MLASSSRTGFNGAAAEGAVSVRVLIVEDNVDAAESLSLFLAQRGHVVATAHDGASALALAAGFQPQVVLCDIELPGNLDGHGVAAALRANDELSGTRLIAMTGHDDLKDRAAASGFSSHLVKPIDFDALQALLAR